MKNCPACQSPLVHESHEGFRVLHCGQCGDHLVSQSRLEAIKRVTRTPAEALKQGAAGFTGDTADRVRCPRCRVTMRKEKLAVPVAGLHADVCDSCKLVWFDGGELALVQLAYEQSEEFRNIDELRQRMAELNASTARKKEFEAALAKLPDARDPVDAAFSEGAWLAFESLFRSLRR